MRENKIVTVDKEAFECSSADNNQTNAYENQVSAENIITEYYSPQVSEKIYSSAEYAAESFNEHLMYQAYGALEMAVFCSQISPEEARELNHYIVSEHISNAEWRSQCEESYKASLRDEDYE